MLRYQTFLKLNERAPAFCAQFCLKKYEVQNVFDFFYNPPHRFWLYILPDKVFAQFDSPDIWLGSCFGVNILLNTTFQSFYNMNCIVENTFESQSQSILKNM